MHATRLADDQLSTWEERQAPISLLFVVISRLSICYKPHSWRMVQGSKSLYFFSGDCYVCILTELSSLRVEGNKCAVN